MLIKVISKSRHYKVRSNRELCIAELLIGDCFVPYNDDFGLSKKGMTSSLFVKCRSMHRMHSRISIAMQTCSIR